MNAIPLNQMVIALFVSTVGLTCLYTFVSTITFYWSLKGLAQSRVRNFIFVLFITVFIGFLYAGWNFMNLVGVISTTGFNKSLMDNIFVLNILALVIYLSFSARNLNHRKPSKKEMFSKLVGTAFEKGSKMRL